MLQLVAPTQKRPKGIVSRGLTPSLPLLKGVTALYMNTTRHPKTIPAHTLPQPKSHHRSNKKERFIFLALCKHRDYQQDAQPRFDQLVAINKIFDRDITQTRSLADQKCASTRLFGSTHCSFFLGRSLADQMCAAVSWGVRSNMRSSACMFTRVCDTARASVPSERMDCMGPCSSLFTMPRDRSSNALRCFLSSPSPIFFRAFSSSIIRISSALVRKRLMVGTVSSESRHASKLPCS
mmetsp:Transcript_10740/g.18417  ORF Transcript_10740/g.18417 Transcript_10740/m.18417 type:complete len:237 (+) Transcript_10740:150-860(+)